MARYDTDPEPDLNLSLSLSINLTLTMSLNLTLLTLILSSSSGSIPVATIYSLMLVALANGSQGQDPEAKVWTFEAKNINVVLDDPRGQGLASRTTSLQTVHCQLFL